VAARPCQQLAHLSALSSLSRTSCTSRRVMGGLRCSLQARCHASNSSTVTPWLETCIQGWNQCTHYELKERRNTPAATQLFGHLPRKGRKVGTVRKVRKVRKGETICTSILCLLHHHGRGRALHLRQRHAALAVPPGHPQPLVRLGSSGAKGVGAAPGLARVPAPTRRRQAHEGWAGADPG
jgi:hypothetical protein